MGQIYIKPREIESLYTYNSSKAANRGKNTELHLHVLESLQNKKQRTQKSKQIKRIKYTDIQPLADANIICEWLVNDILNGKNNTNEAMHIYNNMEDL